MRNNPRVVKEKEMMRMVEPEFYAEIDEKEYIERT